MPIAPFDASRAFTVSALTLLANGRHYVRGEGFVKESVPPLILKRLFDAKSIRYSDDPNGGFAPSDPLLNRKRERKAAKLAARKPTIDEDAEAEALKEANSLKDLMDMAKGIEGVRAGMNKKAVALAIIRAGRGPT